MILDYKHMRKHSLLYREMKQNFMQVRLIDFNCGAHSLFIMPIIWLATVDINAIYDNWSVDSGKWQVKKENVILRTALLSHL